MILIFLVKPVHSPHGALSLNFQFFQHSLRRRDLKPIYYYQWSLKNVTAVVLCMYIWSSKQTGSTIFISSFVRRLSWTKGINLRFDALG